MWVVSRFSSNVLLAAVGVIGEPSAAVNTHAGTWLCQTSVWPRTCMPFAFASATWASAVAKVKLPSVGWSELHFMSFSDVRLLKCFVNRNACSPVTSPCQTAAPTGK